MMRGEVKEAMYWQPGDNGRAQCLLCPHGCRVAEGETGRCHVRQCLHGSLRTLNYERVAAAHWDPVEKKPLFHFHPGREILSLGTVGCNLACAFCQNWNISQIVTETPRMTAKEAVALAHTRPGNLGIAYTYNEPFIWYEFVWETAPLVREVGLCNVLVTNGYVQEEPLRALLPFIDAMNVDIKAMSDRFYRELCRGRPEPPRRTVEIAHEAGCLVEVTNLIIPNWNDHEEEIAALADWLAGVDPDIPLHLTRYHPDHQFTEPPTPSETLLRAREIARQRLNYVYLGNIAAVAGEDTVCPKCGKKVVTRAGFTVEEVHLRNGACAHCGHAIGIVGGEN